MHWFVKFNNLLFKNQYLQGLNNCGNTKTCILNEKLGGNMFSSKRNKKGVELMNSIISGLLVSDLSKKRKMEILYIDDEYYSAVKELEENQLNITYINDCSNPLIAMPFDIVLVDIQKIATKRGNNEGIGLAIDIKKNFPEKKVFLYSMHDQLIMKAYKMIEETSIKYQAATQYKYIGIIKKDTTSEELLKHIEKAIEETQATDYEWKHIKYKLMCKGTSENDITKIQKIYSDLKENKKIENVVEEMERLSIDKSIVIGLIQILISAAQLLK